MLASRGRTVTAALAASVAFALPAAVPGTASAAQPVALPSRATAAPAGFPVLRVGARSNDVAAVQLLLAAAGEPVTVDGRFGPETQRLVRGFQSQRGLAADGVVGPATWRALLVTVSPRRPASPPAVLAVKLLLLGARAPSTPADLRDFTRNAVATYDTDAVASVRAAQRRASVTVDGVVGAVTWRVLAADPANRTTPGAPAARPLLVLEGDRLGFFVGGAAIRQVPFGSPATVVRTALRATLGPLRTTALASCGQGPRTAASYDGFSVLLNGDRFVGWTDEGRSGRRLTTANGVGVGSTLAMLRRSLGTVAVTTGSLGAEWIAAGGLSGVLTGRESTSRITVISGGETCFFR